MVWTALCLALISWPLQVFSHATTCNNGSYSAFMGGSLLTAPLLLAVAILLVASRKSSTARVAAAFWLACCLCSMVIFDADIVFNTIVFGTPCGRDYVNDLVQVEASHRILIVFAYLVMPMVDVALAGLFIWRSGQAQSRNPNI